MAGGTRREARERALSILYEAEARGVAVGDVLGDVAVEPDPFAAGLVEGVAANGERIDSLIVRHAIGWELARMPVIDRCLLRIGVYELLETDTPTAVVISEAVELAKRYSTEDSGRFVNGLLSAVERPS
jgi:N utilization substance protein B